MKKIIILGASGFIGKALSKKFNKEEFDVRGFSSKECNLLFPESIERALSFITPEDVIIFSSFITRQVEDNFEVMGKNLQMVNNLISFIEKKPISKLIFLSTIEVYGEVNNKEITEELIPEPRNYYAIAKLTSEKILRNCCSRLKIPLSILRLPGIFGYGDKGRSTISKLFTSALNGKITLYGNDKRDFVHIDDLYNLVLRIIDDKDKPLVNENTLLLNVATGQSYQMQEIAEFLKNSLNNEVLIEYVDKEKQDLVFNISRVEKEFPDFKFIDFKNRLLQYIKENLR